MMRQPALFPIAFAGVLAASAFATSWAEAAALYWDGTDTTANADGGTGIWNTTSTNWDDAATGGANTAWGTGGNVNIANFGGNGGTVTLGSDMGPVGAYPNAINVTAGNYVIDLNSLGLAWRGSGLTVSSGATLVIQNGTVTLLNTGFSVTGSNALTISAKVTEASAGTAFSKFGGGDITLTNNANDFTGKFYGQNGGSVYFSSIKNSGVASAAGAGSTVETGFNNTMVYTGTGDSTNRTLSLIGGGNDTLKNNGLGALVWTGAFSNTKTVSSTLTFGGTNTSSNEFQGALANASGFSLSVTKADAGTWILSGANSYTGGTTVSGGTLSFGSTTAIGTGAMTLSGGNLDSSVANLVNASNNAQNWNSNFTFVGTQSLNLGTGAVILNATRQVTVTANTLTVGGAIAGSGFGLTKAGAGVLSLLGANTYTGTTTLSAGTLRADAADVAATSGALGNGGDITFSGGTLQYTAASAGTDYSARIKNSTTGGGIKIDTNGQNITFGSALASSNTAGLTKEGGGQLELKMSAAAQYSGTTTINGGTLKFSGAVDLDGISSSSININNGASLIIYSDFNRTTLSNSKTFTFGSTGGGSIIYDKGNHLWQSSTGKFVTTGGTQNIISSANGGFINPQGSNTVNFDVADGSDAVDLLVSVTISNGNYSKSGAGTMSLTSSSTLGGGGVSQPNLTINAGTFDVGGSARLTTSGQSTGVVTSDILNNGFYSHSSSGAQTLSGLISGSGSLIKSNSASTLTLSGTSANTFSGLTTVNGGTLLLNKTAGVNAIAGNVTIGDASGVDILQLSASDQIANTSILTFNGTSANAGTFRLSAQSETVGGIVSTSGAGIIENGSAGTSTLTLDVNTTDRVFSGIIQNGAAGTLALIKTGNAVQSLSGANTYSGTTTISGGSVILGSGTGTTGTGAVTVQTGGTILGTGVVRGTTFTLDNGATLRPGDSAADSAHGTLTFTPASASGSTSSLQGSIILGITSPTTTDATYGGNLLGSAGYNAWVDAVSGTGGHDRLVFNNPTSGTGYNLDFLTTTGSLQIVGSSFTPQQGMAFNLLDWGNLVTPSFTGFTFNSGLLTGNGDEGADLDLPDLTGSGLLWDFSRFTTSGVVVIVPEPSRALLLLVGLFGLLTRRRR